MTSAAQNKLMTEIGPGSSAGALLREYWQPAALTEELNGARPLVPVKLLGEELVLFRDSSGRLALMDRRCPHRISRHGLWDESQAPACCPRISSRRSQN
jgi:hypothetical protein